MKAPAAARLLCVLPNWIGDAVLCLPALQVLADSGARLVLVGRPGVRRIVHSIQRDAEWHDLPQRRLSRLRLAWHLRRQPTAGAVLFTPSFSSAAFAWMSGSRVRCGEASDARTVLLSHPQGRISRQRHLALSFQDLAQACLRALHPGAARETAATPAFPEGLLHLPHLRVRADERQALQRLPQAVQGAVVVAPGARFGPAKQYPAERFATAAAALAQTWSTAVVLVGTAQDAASTAAVRQQLPEAVDLTGRTDLGQLLAVLEAARIVLSNDSGTMHLAAAVGAPVVGVFGSTNPSWTAPLGARSAALSHPVFCWPCYARHCREDFACMLQQPPEKLVAAARRLVDNADL